MYIPLHFYDVSLFSYVFINIHEYANLIICISEHRMKVLCHNIQLVPGLKVSDELLLRYEYFVGTSPFFRSALCVAMETMQFHIAQMCFSLGQYFSKLWWSHITI